MSEKALAYLPVELKHKTLVVVEAAGLGQGMDIESREPGLLSEEMLDPNAPPFRASTRGPRSPDRQCRADQHQPFARELIDH